MWTVVYILPNRNYAEQMKEILMEAGLLAMLRAAGSPRQDGKCPVEILVLESEAEEASQIISKALPTLGGK